MKSDEILRGSYHRYIAADFLSATVLDRSIPIIIEIDEQNALVPIKRKLLDAVGDVDVLLKSGSTQYMTKVSEINMTGTIVIDAAPLTQRKRFGYADFEEIMRRLRADDGCEWDRAQTHESIRINLIEEAYELLEAIDAKDADMMREESGDVLMQAVFHALIAEKEGEFTSNDMYTELCRKLIDRHTHIFGSNHANTPEEALKFWTEAKKKEKKYKSMGDAMQRVPKNLPSLLYAEKLQKLAKKCGFDWDSVDGAIEKLEEELCELRAADESHRTEEAGDLLFAAVNVLRFYNVESEMALRGASDKFLRRFERVEALAGADGKQMSDYTLDQLDKFWDMAKKEENA